MRNLPPDAVGVDALNAFKVSDYCVIRHVNYRGFSAVRSGIEASGHMVTLPQGPLPSVLL